MELKMFSEGIFSKKKVPSYDEETGEHHSNDDVAAFHKKHAELEEIGKRLHASGHHIHIDYKSPDVVRHGNSSGTHWFNRGLNVEKKIQISKRVPLRPWK